MSSSSNSFPDTQPFDLKEAVDEVEPEQPQPWAHLVPLDHHFPMVELTKVILKSFKFMILTNLENSYFHTFSNIV